MLLIRLNILLVTTGFCVQAAPSVDKILNHPVPLVEVDGRTAPCPYDGTWPNYYDCSTYILCTNGISYVMPCPSGLIWNVSTGRCDWPSATDCVVYPSPNMDKQ